tara:strand:+ start:516 stop:1247 length:732 start_codon:yes stop_codon:yes gene_type:complete
MIVIAGPCQHESYSDSLDIAIECQKVCDSFKIDYFFKASFDKANRTNDESPRGLGLEECKYDFEMLRKQFRVTTDFHETSQIDQLDVDCYQIPAFLSKQTDLIKKAAATGKKVNIKKGQFMSPDDVKGILSKTSGRENGIWITERGTQFGYGRTVIDFQSIQDMKELNVPLFLDVTHSISERKYARQMASIAGHLNMFLFVEVHKDPDRAPSDGKKMIALKDFKDLIGRYVYSNLHSGSFRKF